VRKPGGEDAPLGGRGFGSLFHQPGRTGEEPQVHAIQIIPYVPPGIITDVLGYANEQKR